MKRKLSHKQVCWQVGWRIANILVIEPLENGGAEWDAVLACSVTGVTVKNVSNPDRLQGSLFTDRAS